MNLSTKEKIFAFLALAAVSLIIFGNGIGGNFVYDDDWVISRNPTLVNFSSIPGQFLSSYHYLQPETGLYRPLTLISYAFNLVFGKGPIGFHLVNIILHAINAFLIFVLLFELFKSKRLAYISSFLFLLLPIHVEAVTSISGRGDLLAFFFSILTFDFLRRGKYKTSSVFLLLGLFSKESAIGILPVLAFYPWVHKREKIIEIVKKMFYFLPSIALYAVMRYLALKDNFLSNDASHIYNPLKFTDPLTRFYSALKVMFLYIWKTIIPLHLSADYSFDQITLIKSFLSPWVLSGVVLLALIFAVIFWSRTKKSALAFGAAVFVSSYFVISNFIFPIGTIMGERAFYLPSLGIAVMLAFAAEKLTQKKFLKFPLLVILLFLSLFYSRLIFLKNRVWASGEVLFNDMVKESPYSVHAKTNLGIYYAKTNKWDKAKVFLEEAYKITPDHPPLLDALGIIAEHENRYKDAERFYLKAISIRPHYATALSNLGRMYFELGQYENSAEIYWREFSFQQKPAYILVYAMSKSKLGKYDEAIGAIKKYYGENPNDLKLKFALGYAYYKKGDKAVADRYFKESKNPAISDEEFIKGLEKF